MHHIGNLDGWIKGNDPFNKPGDRVALEVCMNRNVEINKKYFKYKYFI